MNNEVKVQQYERELELIDVWHFIQRQRMFLAVVFLSIAGLTFTYAITRPTTWQSRVSIVVGEKLFFLQQQQLQIESSEEMKYRYSKNATITPIKNTRIIEITTTANSKELAIEQATIKLNEIIANHNQIFEDKKIEFVRLIDALSQDNINKTELLRLLDNASSSTITKQLSDINTEEKRYSGMLMKILGNGTFIGLAITFLLAGIKDYFEGNRRLEQKV